MNALIRGLAGAGGAASTAGQYYQNAANQIVNAYGSPAANIFSKEEIAALQPGFKQQQQGLIGQENALGINGSGAERANLSDLYGQQSAAEASGIAPLYSQALEQYGGIIAAEPGAQNTAYQDAINQFYTGISDAGSIAAGLPPSATPTQGGTFYSGDPATSSTDATYSSPGNPYG